MITCGVDPRASTERLRDASRASPSIESVCWRKLTLAPRRVCKPTSSDRGTACARSVSSPSPGRLSRASHPGAIVGRCRLRREKWSYFVVVDASVGMTFWAGAIVGVLWGVLLMVVGRWAIAATKRASRRRRQRRYSKSSKREPLPQLWATGAGYRDAGAAGTARRAPGGLDDYREGPRQRPGFNPKPGPRDW